MPHAARSIGDEELPKKLPRIDPGKSHCWLMTTAAIKIITTPTNRAIRCCMKGREKLFSTIAHSYGVILLPP